MQLEALRVGEQGRIARQFLHGGEMRVAGKEPLRFCQAAIQLGALRRERDRPFEGVPRLLQPAERLQDIGEVVLSVGQIRIERESLFQARNGLIQLA